MIMKELRKGRANYVSSRRQLQAAGTLMLVLTAPTCILGFGISIPVQAVPVSVRCTNMLVNERAGVSHRVKHSAGSWER